MTSCQIDILRALLHRASSLLTTSESETLSVAISELEQAKGMTPLKMKYGRDHDKHITLGEIVEKLLPLVSDKERFIDVLDEEFLFGAWEERFRHTDLNFIRDMRGIVWEFAKQAGRMREAADEWLDESVDILLNRMNLTADPATDEPRNFAPDLRTKAAIAAWLLDSRKPLLRAALAPTGSEQEKR